MAREKHVLSESAVAHAWAHQTQGDARNPRNTFYFNGRTIYSYGGHFPIAEIIHKPEDDKKPTGVGTVVLFTTRTYSNTTAGHIGMVRRSIPDSYKTFYVPKFFTYPHKKEDKNTRDYRLKAHTDNMLYYIKDIEDFAKRQAKARTYNYWEHIRASISTIQDYVEYWKCPKVVSKEWKWLLDTTMTTEEQQVKLLGKAVDFFAKEKERKKKLSEKAQVFFNEWLEGQHDKGAINRNNFQEVLGGYVMLRCVYSNPDKTATVEPVKMVQTSLGIEVTYEEGLKLFHLIKKVRERKKPFPSGDANYGRVMIGSYNIDRIDENGNVTAGCHKIKWSEIERLTTKEGIV